MSATNATRSPPAAATPARSRRFTGHVRGDDGLTALTLEHYPGMTEREIARLSTKRKALELLRRHHHPSRRQARVRASASSCRGRVAASQRPLSRLANF